MNWGCEGEVSLGYKVQCNPTVPFITAVQVVKVCQKWLPNLWDEE